MAEATGLVAAYLLDGRGGGRPLDWKAVRGWRPEQGLLWVHLDYTVDEARRWLREESGLEPLIAEALLAEETRPRSERIGDGALAIFRGVNSNLGAEPQDMVSIRIWLEAGRIVSTRKRRLLSVQDLRDAIADGNGPASPGEFLAAIADRLVVRMRDVIEGLDDRVAELEEAILEDAGGRLRQGLAALRRETIILRRYLAPQREALLRLQRERFAWSCEDDRLHLREVADTVTRYVEELDAARERAALAGEELASRQAEVLNSRMYMLSMVAAVFLPLGFLTGLLGINVAGIPGADNPYAFFLVLLFLVVLVALQIVVFRRRHWL